jgi:NTP pyrophosphatase (non-canonical NTP hydrolase)
MKYDEFMDATPEDVELAGDVLLSACHGAAVKSGWWIDAETGEDVRTWEKKYFLCWVATKIHSEVSEGLEGHRKNLMDDHLPHRPMLEAELADAVIRIADLAGGLGLDLGGAIREKLAFNAVRPDHKIDHRQGVGGKAY